MTKGRLEAFSDGVIAILITIMVLELKVPHGAELSDLAGKWPVFFSYVLSFIYIGIYWNNHHHLFHAVHRISGGVLWANLHLLFWLSLTSFATGWMGENHFEKWPVVVYGLVLLANSIAYWIMVRFIIAANGSDSAVARAVGKDWKGMVSTLIYLVSIGLAFIHPLLGVAGYAIVACIWFIPDKRIERVLPEKAG